MKARLYLFKDENGPLPPGCVRTPWRWAVHVFEVHWKIENDCENYRTKAEARRGAKAMARHCDIEIVEER